MHEAYEAELRMAVAEGVLSREEAEALRAEAARLGRPPLELLAERGRISEDTLTSLRREARPESAGQGAGPPRGEEGARAEVPRDMGGHGETPPRDTGGRTPAPDATLASDGAARVPVARADAPAFPVPGWDRYRAIRFLGQGGMGRVFLAHDTRLHRDVALKFVRDDDAELTRRFVSEARAQARVDHERVCRVYEVGEVQGRAYIAMQHVDGQPLSALAGTLTVEQKALVLREAAHGVHAAHRAGLVHRDLKPSNILVERTEDGGLRPYVMDFGLARDWKEGVTATGTVLGTPHYMAPEQARGEVARLDRRADVYSLGATLYHLLTGEPPVPGANGLEVLNRIATHEPRPPRALDPNLPADLEAVVLKCLEKDRSRRYDSARALADDLDRFLNGEPVKARTGPGYRLRKRLRKHWRAVAVVSVALLAVALGLGQAVLARREVSRREQLARRFTEGVERIEALARYAGQAPLHDTREDLGALRARMADIEARMREAGPVAEGPGHYALGRGSLALGDDEAARAHLETAWAAGDQEPRVAYALALVMGRLYQRARLEADRHPDTATREAKRQEAERKYRDPALDFLRRSQGAEVPAPEYVAALRAFHEDRFDEALKQLDTLGDRLPWFHEAPQLRGDILLARAVRHATAGEREAARADFEAGRQTYAKAAAIGRSVPAVHRALAELEQEALILESSGRGDVMPPYTRGLEAVSRALTAAPDQPALHVLEASFHRRLAQQRVSQGGEVEPLLTRTIDAARKAVALAPTLPAARHSLAMGLWQWARYRQDRNQDPREQLREAAATFESIPPEARDYDFQLNLGVVFKVWADYEDQRGGDSLPYREKAIAAYRAALALDARRPDAWINLGTAYVNRAGNPRAPHPDEDLAEAATALEKARSIDPGHVVPWFYSGEVYRTQAQRRRDHGGDGRPDLARALEAYRRGVAINPRLPPLLNGVGISLLEQAKEAWDHGEDPEPLLREARETFEQAITVAPQVAFAHNNLGELHAWRATYQLARGEAPTESARAAEAALQRATTLMPDLPQAWANLGRVHQTRAASALEAGQDPRPHVERATEALRRALALNPALAQGWRWLGEAQALAARWRSRQGSGRDTDFEQAAQSFQKALDLEPLSLEYRLAFSRFCLDWGTWRAVTGGQAVVPLKQGLSLVEKVLASRPEWPEARALRAGVFLAMTWTAHPTEEVAAWRRQAREDLTRAVAANPHLERTWKAWLRRMRERATAGP